MSVFVGKAATWQGFSVPHANDVAIPVFIKICPSAFSFEGAHTDEGSSSHVILSVKVIGLGTLIGCLNLGKHIPCHGDT